MNPFIKVWWTLKGVGWDNVPRRLIQAWRLRSGYLKKRLDPKNFSEVAFRCQVSITPDEVRKSLQNCFPHFVASAKDMPAWSAKHVAPSLLYERLLLPCQKALEGDYLYFGHWYGKLGWPPDFNLDPVHGIRYPNDEHAMKTARSGPPRDDVKLVWEASRLTMACFFARAYAHTNAERWASAFWEMFDAWVEQNPVMMSPAWGCGQESTFRMMAVLFAATVTLTSNAVTDERLLRLAQFVWQTGKLINTNINYALSQKNNHGISESVGLLTAGRFLEIFDWESRADKYLAAEVTRQIYVDGSFVQHSMNYHRVMLDDLLWTIALCESYLPQGVGEKFERAADWLAEFVDRKSGRVPNYGSNDGAQILSLSCCDYLDYRPITQATQLRFHGKRVFDAGPWDEKAFWLFGNEILTPVEQKAKLAPSFEAKDGGYYMMRGERSWCMTRCHTYRDRPSEQDMLHFDLWFDGENIVRDGGSYFYYTTDPVSRFFKSKSAHNTIEIDGQGPMLKGPRFLHFYWYKSKLLCFENISELHNVFEGEHYGYHRLPGQVTHRRKIEREGDSWTVTDYLFAKTPGTHDIVSRFRLAPGEWNQMEDEQTIAWRKNNFVVSWQKVPGFSTRLISGQIDPPEGWESLYYGKNHAMPTIVIRGKVTLHNKSQVLKYHFFED
ncbi:MAG: heparinase II/III family protein [Planctomycetaceae bacterium]|nr:heparinase II/III family protein [Planctomycetaceae bacterium]